MPDKYETYGIAVHDTDAGSVCEVLMPEKSFYGTYMENEVESIRKRIAESVAIPSRYLFPEHYNCRSQIKEIEMKTKMNIRVQEVENGFLITDDAGRMPGHAQGKVYIAADIGEVGKVLKQLDKDNAPKELK